MFKHLKQPQPFFVQGTRDSVPISLSFAFLFFSVGALCAQYGYHAVQAALMTLLVFAAPLQVFIVQHGDVITLPALLIGCLLINFRFFILSSVLSDRFQSIPLAKLLPSILMMSASTFAVSNSRQNGFPAQMFEYYLGVGALAISTALVATLAGITLASAVDALVLKWVGMILPIHFMTLTGLQWPKYKPVIITCAAAVLTPIAGAIIGNAQALVLPFIVGAMGVAADYLFESLSKKNE